MVLAILRPALSVHASTLLLALFLATACSARAESFDPNDPHSPLRLVRAIELPNVKGRIDHMALDAGGRHLFVAENGNGSVDDIDLATGKLAGRIVGLHEPQGIAWLRAQKEIAVASGDGSLAFYRASDLQRVADVDLGADADNVRIDQRNGNLVVGYGSGGLAVIDPATHRVTGRLILPGHPEAFELLGSKVFVNVPHAHGIVIADLDRERVSSTLGTGLHFANFPMASDASGSKVALVYRAPAMLSVLDARSGKEIFSASTCDDADDLYFRAGQLVVVCGSGAVELINGTARQSIATKRGARTGLLDAADGHLFIAVPARQGPAAIWEMSFR